MSLPDIIKRIRSGVVKITFYDAGDPVSSGSGFLSRDRLITNSHVIVDDRLQETLVGVRFGDTEGNEDEIQIDYRDFVSLVEIGSEPDRFDYSVLNIEGINYRERHQFVLSDHSEVDEGQEVLALGYPFGDNHLTSHFGYVSAIYQHTDFDHHTIKLDASINNGNSGGPLVNLATLNVVGIITRKATGLTNSFEGVIRSLDRNIQALAGQDARVQIGGIDPIQSLRATQSQLKILCENIERSANTGIGYAFSCQNLIESLDNR